MDADLKAIQQDLIDGYLVHNQRIHAATKNLDYYRGHLHKYWAERYDGIKPIHRPSMFLKFVVDHISSLYADQPKRTIIGVPAATQWLQQIYKDNNMWAKWHTAEKLTAISDVAAFQVAGTTDPKKPIKINLWSSDTIHVYTDPDDCLTANAVITIDEYNHRKRYQVWTAETYEVYMTQPNDVAQQAVIKVTQEANPYGVLPFSFCHFNYPTLDFWSGGPGTNLREANHYINEILSQVGGAVKYCCNPVLVAYNTQENFALPENYEPGDCWTPSSDHDDNGVQRDPRLEYLQPNYGFVQEAWTDLVNYTNHILETNGIPESAVRMVQSVARSGASIMAEQFPLIQWAKSRQPQYKHYEYDLAKLCFQVAEAHLKGSGAVHPIVRHIAETGFELSVTYANQYSDVPGPERDRAADWELAEGFKSRIMVQMERTGCTREEALAHFAEVAEDNEQVTLILQLPDKDGVDESAAAKAKELADQEENTNGEENGPDTDRDTGTEGSDDSNL